MTWTMCITTLCTLVYLLTSFHDTFAQPLNRGLNIEAYQIWTTKVSFLSTLPPVPDWVNRITDEDISIIANSGFDFVRINFDPSPLLWVADDKREAIYESLILSVKKVQAAGLRAVVDLHVMEESEGRPQGRHSILMTGAFKGASEFQRYCEIVSHLAALLHRFPVESVALELFNEPDQDWFSTSEATDIWPDQLRALYDAARKGSERLPLILTGARGGGVEGLVRVDPAHYLGDKSIFWSFHYYSPVIFTHAGLPWSQDYTRYLNSMTFPAPSGEKTGRLITAASDAIRASKMFEDRKAKEIASLRSNMVRYSVDWSDASEIDHAFARVKKWADENGVKSEKILLGEFGVYRDAVEPEAWRRYIETVRVAAESNGFAWAIYTVGFADPGKSFSILNAHKPHAIDETILDALGLTCTQDCRGQ